MNEIEQVCARLFAHGALRRDEVRELEHPQIRAEVEARLNACGLSLATSAYSDYYGIRLRPDIGDATVLDAPANLELGRDACALLTVLWARLALQQRTVGDSQEIPTDQPSLLPQERAAKARSFTASIRFETLVREFGPRPLDGARSRTVAPPFRMCIYRHARAGSWTWLRHRVCPWPGRAHLPAKVFWL